MSTRKRTTFGAETSPKLLELESEYNALVTRVDRVNKDVAHLLTGLSSDYDQAVHRILTKPTASEEPMIKAWSKFGGKDFVRDPKLSWTQTLKATVTPFGCACLVVYGRAWVDSAQAHMLKLAQQIQKEKKNCAPPHKLS